MKNLVIVGTGQSAAQCVLTLIRNKFKGQITLVGAEKHLPYQRPLCQKNIYLMKLPLKGST